MTLIKQISWPLKNVWIVVFAWFQRVHIQHLVIHTGELYGFVKWTDKMEKRIVHASYMRNGTRLAFKPNGKFLDYLTILFCGIAKNFTFTSGITKMGYHFNSKMGITTSFDLTFVFHCSDTGFLSAKFEKTN